MNPSHLLPSRKLSTSVGIAESMEDAMAYKVLTDDNKKIVY